MKPKKLYRYHDKKLEKHAITKSCNPQIELKHGEQYAGGDYNFNGTIYRCCEFYGFSHIVEAKREEIENTKRRIYEDKRWLEKLTNSSS